jgi:two-component system, NarL family, nitrate/nitrite response regulator NarL
LRQRTHSGKVFVHMSDPIDKPIRIFILDPYILIRQGLRMVIESDPGMNVIGDAGDSATALEMVSLQKPDIVLLKLNPAGDPGLDVIPRLLQLCGQIRIILMTTTDDLQICSQAIQKGVLGIISKQQSSKILLKAIKKVFDGEVWIERSMMANILNALSLPHRFPVIDSETEHISQLSDRELQVIQLIGLGLKNKQIAAQLCISEVTVRHHLTSVFNKLGVSDRLELLVFAHRSGLTKP